MFPHDHGSVPDGVEVAEQDLIDQISELERSKASAAAEQARLTEKLHRMRSESEARRGVPSRKRCQGLAAEIGLARRMSPHRGATQLGLATALVREMPHTLDLLTRGEISEWRATLVVGETAQLSREHREQVDAELAEKLASMGDREAATAARAIGYRLDPGAVLRRSSHARADRNVTLRPAPDTMAYLTALLPVEQAVACKVALLKAVENALAAGDTRTRGQIMADTLVERLTGQATAGGVDVEVHVAMSDTTLLSDDDAPAHVREYGFVPAAIARRLVRTAHRAWLRRLYLHPTDGSLVAMDSRRRAFGGELREVLIVRDQLCRTPWCDAPIRHADHPVRVADGGPTTAENGQGLCEACNYAKEAPGWRATRTGTGRHQITLTTPTGHTYVSTAPDPPGFRGPPPEHHGDLVQFFGEPISLDEMLNNLDAGLAPA